MYLYNMQINSFRGNNFNFKSVFPVEEPIDDPFFADFRNELREHYYEKELPYHSIYEEQGRMTDYKFGNSVNSIEKTHKHVNKNEILSLPLNNVKRIDGFENSYRGQTLCFAKNKYLETIKNAGVDTVIDLVGYFDYDTKVNNAGLDYHLFKIKDMYSSPACKSLKDYLNKNKRLLVEAKSEGMDIDIDLYLKRDKELFLNKTRDDINKFVGFINVMSKDNLYIGCEYGTRETDEALMWNSAFNPKNQDKPLNVDKMGLLSNMYNLYYNLLPEDKINMGWTKDTESKFIDRMTDCQLKLWSK